MQLLSKQSLRSASLITASIALTIGLAPLAQAHPGHLGPSIGFFHGLGHPLGGLDHILAMVAVGLWSAQLGGSALWRLPSVFVAMMAIGGAIGLTGVTLPMAEPVVLLSSLAIGLLVVIARRLPLGISSSLVALFALCHGVVHGAEMPSQALALHYSLGFMLSTAVLHLVGLGAGLVLQQAAGADRSLRLVGGAIAIGGCSLILQAL
jgi:urease accessory protein